MKVHLTRDSVFSARDDVDSVQRYDLSVPDGASMGEVVSLVAKSQFLPAIPGGKATWSLASNVPLAVIAQQWSQPKLLFLLRDDLVDRSEDTLRIHVNYHAQIDPDIVYDVLWRLKLRAI